MAITTTLSRLKNYFIGWHTANYRTLHEFTDQITEEEPDGSKLVESKTIFKYIKDLLGDKDTPDENTVWGNIGRICDPRYAGSTLWSNICGIWNKIGDSCSTYFGTGGTYSPHLTISCQIKHIWDNLGSWGDAIDMDNPADPKTIWGWIHKFMLTTENLRSRTTNLENRTPFNHTSLLYTSMYNPHEKSWHSERDFRSYYINSFEAVRWGPFIYYQFEFANQYKPLNLNSDTWVEIFTFTPGIVDDMFKTDNAVILTSSSAYIDAKIRSNGKVYVTARNGSYTWDGTTPIFTGTGVGTKDSW